MKGLNQRKEILKLADVNELIQIESNYDAKYQQCHTKGVSDHAPLDGYYFIKSIQEQAIAGKTRMVAETRWKFSPYDDFIEDKKVFIQLGFFYTDYSIGPKNIAPENLTGQVIHVVYTQLLNAIVGKKTNIYIVNWKISDIFPSFIGVKTVYREFQQFAESSNYDFTIVIEAEAHPDEYLLEEVIYAETVDPNDNIYDEPDLEEN